MLLIMILHTFFFKQKTAYELRISDWSSDVCSSDLREMRPARDRHRQREYRAIGRARILIEDHAVAPHRHRERGMARAEGGVPRVRIEHETRPSMAERHPFADPRERLGTRRNGLEIIAARGDSPGDRPRTGPGADPPRRDARRRGRRGCWPSN